MGVTLLRAAAAAGIPLLDVVIDFTVGVDYVAATKHLNSLSEGFELEPSPHSGVQESRIGTATKEALEQLFGCRVQRVPLMVYDTAAEAQLPDYEQCFWEVEKPTRFPVPGTISSFGITQPGNYDDGQWNDPIRVRNDRARRWELWRQDDAGNRYQIATYSTEWTAEAAMRAFEARGHKQVYWVSATTT